MGLLTKLELGAKTWQANPMVDPSGLVVQNGRGTLRRQASMSRLDGPSRMDSVNYRKSAEEQNRKLKEQRLLELTRQLDPNLNRISNVQPQPSSFSSHSPLGNNQTLHAKSHPSSRPPSVSGRSRISPSPSFVGSEGEIMNWQKRRREAEELNSRIESLKLSGMPPDQLPSPVQIPSTPVLQDLLLSNQKIQSSSSKLGINPQLRTSNSPRMNNGGSSIMNQNLNHSEKDLRYQPSIRRAPTPSAIPQNPPLSSLNAPRPSTGFKVSENLESRPVPNSVQDHQTSHYQALKSAEELIVSLRKSHDNLLMRLEEVEKQLSATEVENQDLRTRTDRLESWLTEEQKVKERIELENEQLRSQLDRFLNSNANGQKNPQKFGNDSRMRSMGQAQESYPIGLGEINGQDPYSHNGNGRQFSSLPNQVPNDLKSAQIRAYLLEKDRGLNKNFGVGPQTHQNELGLYSEPNHQNMVNNPNFNQLKRSKSFLVNQPSNKNNNNNNNKNGINYPKTPIVGYNPVIGDQRKGMMNPNYNNIYTNEEEERNPMMMMNFKEGRNDNHDLTYGIDEGLDEQRLNYYNHYNNQIPNHQNYEQHQQFMNHNRSQSYDQTYGF